MYTPMNGIQFYRALMDVHEEARRVGARRHPRRRRVRRALGVRMVNAGLRLIDGPDAGAPRVGVEGS